MLGMGASAIGGRWPRDESSRIVVYRRRSDTRRKATRGGGGSNNQDGHTAPHESGTEADPAAQGQRHTCGSGRDSTNTQSNAALTRRTRGKAWGWGRRTSVRQSSAEDRCIRNAAAVWIGPRDEHAGGPATATVAMRPAAHARCNASPILPSLLAFFVCALALLFQSVAASLRRQLQSLFSFRDASARRTICNDQVHLIAQLVSRESSRVWNTRRRTKWTGDTDPPARVQRCSTKATSKSATQQQATQRIHCFRRRDSHLRLPSTYDFTSPGLATALAISATPRSNSANRPQEIRCSSRLGCIVQLDMIGKADEGREDRSWQHREARGVLDKRASSRRCSQKQTCSAESMVPDVLQRTVRNRF